MKSMELNVVVVDYGCGNKKSLLSAFERLGIEAYVSSSLREIKSAERIVMPGVGSFDRVIRGIEKIGCEEVLIAPSADQRILGICIGMHVLCKESDEGGLPGLGVFSTRVERMDVSSRYLLPNVGWGEVEAESQHNMCSLGFQKEVFYFDHSYCVPSGNTYIAGKSMHSRSFCSVMVSEQHIGVQFHPERSHRQGLAFLERFAKGNIWTRE